MATWHENQGKSPPCSSYQKHDEAMYGGVFHTHYPHYAQRGPAMYAGNANPAGDPYLLGTHSFAVDYGSSEQQPAEHVGGGDCWLPPAHPASPEEVAAMLDEDIAIMNLQQLGGSSAPGKPQRVAAATPTAGDDAGAGAAAAAAGQASWFSAAEQEQVLMLINSRICLDAPSHPAAAVSSVEPGLFHAFAPSPMPAFGPQQHFPFSNDMAAAAAAAAGGRGLKRCSADGIATSSHSSRTDVGRMCRSASDTAAVPSHQAGSPKAPQQQGAWLVACGLAAGACSPGAVSRIQDTDEPSCAGGAGVAGTTAAGCASGNRTAKRSSKAKLGSQAAAAAAAAAGAATTAAQPASNPPGARRVRQRRYNEVVALREELAAVTKKQAGMETRLDALRVDNSSLLTRLADVTSKWQATVADNARLARENGECKALISELQQRLAAYKQQQQQQAVGYACGNAS